MACLNDYLYIITHLAIMVYPICKFISKLLKFLSQILLYQQKEREKNERIFV